MTPDPLIDHHSPVIIFQLIIQPSRFIDYLLIKITQFHFTKLHVRSYSII